MDYIRLTGREGKDVMVCSTHTKRFPLTTLFDSHDYSVRQLELFLVYKIENSLRKMKLLAKCDHLVRSKTLKV